MKKLLTCLALVCVMALSLAMFACTDTPSTSSDGHEHSFATVDLVAATCQTAGTKAHQECLYCHELFIDGKKVSAADLVIPIDENAHVKEAVAEQPATCVAKGVAAHQQCKVCKKLFNAAGSVVTAADLELPVSATAHVYTEVAKVDPADCVTAGMEAHLECSACKKYFNAQKNEVTADSLKIAPKGSHTFDTTTHKCGDCSAYQVQVGDNYYAIDKSNYVPFKTNSAGAHTLPKDSKSTTSGVIPKLVAEPNTFTSQIAKANSGTPSAKSEDEWLIEDNVYTHTRFCYDNGTGYVGKVIFTFDIIASDDINIDKIGFNTVVHADLGVTAGVFVGAKAEGAAYTRSSLKGNVTYRFIGVAVKNAASDIFQIHTVTTDMTPVDISIKNIHVAPIETDVAESTLYFGLATGYPVVPGKCAATTDGNHVITHTEAKAETCTEAGNVEYYYCTACETYFEDQDGATIIDGSSVNIPAMGHAKEAHAAAEASCVATAHDAYVYCSNCEKYFTDDTCATETTFAAIFGGKEIADHNFGTDGVCTVCRLAKETLKTYSATGNGKWNGTNKANILSNLRKEGNEGTYSIQVKSNGSTAAVAGDNKDMFAVAIEANDTEKTNSIQLRHIVAKDGANYVGKFVYAIDFKVTAGKGTAENGEKVKLFVGWYLDEKVGVVPETEMEFVIGKTYRFVIEAETTAATQFIQLNVRQSAGSGASIELSNMSVLYKTETTGKATLEAKAFAALVKEEAKTEAQA